jgi:hypothetical protein
MPLRQGYRVKLSPRNREIAFVEKFGPLRVHRLNLDPLSERGRNQPVQECNHQDKPSHDQLPFFAFDPKYPIAL